MNTGNFAVNHVWLVPGLGLVILSTNVRFHRCLVDWWFPNVHVKSNRGMVDRLIDVNRKQVKEWVRPWLTSTGARLNGWLMPG
jgi:hypothetical protein